MPHARSSCSRDEYRRVSDSVTLDVLLQLKSLCGARLPMTIVECVAEDNRRRARQQGATTTLRAIRAYPEIIVRALVAPGSETILENLFTHRDDHAMRYDVTLTGTTWSDAVCRIMMAGLGTLMAYVTRDNDIVCHPRHDHRFDARALILIVRAEAIPSAAELERCLRQPSPDPARPSATA